MSDFNSYVAGIPCTIAIQSYADVPSRLYGHPDDSTEGYYECEYEICDRKGRPAPWLERKATKEDHRRIEAEIEAYYRRQEDYYDA